MIAFEIYASIKDNEVKNIVSYVANTGGYTLANMDAVVQYGDGAFAIEVTQIPVYIGDTYRNGQFYRVIGGVESIINPVPTEEEQVLDLNAAVDDILIEILGG